MKAAKNIAILGGGEEELNILSEFHRNPVYNVIAIYDRDPMAIGLEIAEIIGIPRFTDEKFLETFRKADYIIVTDKRKLYIEEIDLLKREHLKIINPSEAVNCLALDNPDEIPEDRPPWPSHLEQALEYIKRITDRGRLLKWLLEISVRAVRATTGSIMLYSEKTQELYIGYAMGLSEEVVKKTRQKIGEGISGKVAENRKSMLIRQIIDTPLYDDGRERDLIASSISTPLIFEGSLLGVLNVSTNKGEKQLSEEDIRTIDLLASKISPILEQHLRMDVGNLRQIEYKIRNYMESLFQCDLGFHEKFTLLCRTLSEKLCADTATIYTATSEGDWLILGGSDRQVPADEPAPRIHCNKGCLSRVYLEGEEILMTEARKGNGFELKSAKNSITTIYLPLEHNESLGVLVLEFSMLEAFEQFMKLKETLRFQVGFFIYSQLRELKQLRKMKSLEELSSLTPHLMGIKGLSKKIWHIPAILSSLVDAKMGSFHYLGPGNQEKSYYKFPENKQEKKIRIDYDNELVARALKRKKTECISYLSVDIETCEKIPIYKSVIIYPLFLSGKIFALYIGYDKRPSTPLDSSIFGSHEIEMLGKVSKILGPILSKTDQPSDEKPALSFSNLLKSNQKMLLDRIGEEITRAERYHHGFTVTLIKIYGLADLLKSDYTGALSLINEMSQKIRQKVRKTDFFSWIEGDLFGILSLESYQRIGYLESRLLKACETVLTKSSYYDDKSFYPSSAFALYPGACDTPSELINEAKSKL